MEATEAGDTPLHVSLTQWLNTLDLSSNNSNNGTSYPRSFLPTLCFFFVLETYPFHSIFSYRVLWFSEIFDGVLMAEALTQIAPDFFTPNWNSKIKPDVGSNWRLKVSNLKKIVERILGNAKHL